jgi:hypothetical protein
MSDELARIQSICLDQGTGETARQREQITCVIGEESVDLEIRSLTIKEFHDVEPKPETKRRVDGDVDDDIFLVAKTAYVPGTDDRPFDSPDAIARLHDAPFSANGWIARCVQVANYVMGFTASVPEGVQDPRLDEIHTAAAELESICRQAQQEGEPLDPEEVAFIAKEIQMGANLLDEGSSSKKKSATDLAN